MNTAEGRGEVTLSSLAHLRVNDYWRQVIGFFSSSSLGFDLLIAYTIPLVMCSGRFLSKMLCQDISCPC